MHWRVALTALLVTHAADAESIRDRGSDFSIDVDTTSACVLVPLERRVDAACAGIDVDTIPTRLAQMGGKEARYVFLASMPLPLSGRYLFGVIRLTPPTGVDRDGLTLDTRADMKRALRNVARSNDSFDVSLPDESSVRTANGIDSESINFDAWSHVDPSKKLVAYFALYFGAEDFVIQTFTEAENAAIVNERAQRALATVRVKGRQSWAPNPEAIGSAVRWFSTISIVGAVLAVAILVLRDASRWRRVKPKRDPSLVDVRGYVRARNIGLLAIVATFASTALRIVALVSDGPTAKLADLAASLTVWLAFVPLLVWVHRTVINARSLGCTVSISPTMAVTWFFVPVASVYMPYRALAEVAATARRRRSRMRTIGLVAAWWLAWIGSLACRLFAFAALAALLAAVAGALGAMMVVALDRDHEYLRHGAKR